jgi:hypothetical protein
MIHRAPAAMIGWAAAPPPPGPPPCPGVAPAAGGAGGGAAIVSSCHVARALPAIDPPPVTIGAEACSGVA